MLGLQFEDRHTIEHTKGHATKSEDLLMDTPSYRGFKIPVLEHLIDRGLSTAQLPGQSDVCIQDWMGLSGDRGLSLNPTYHCLT